MCMAIEGSSSSNAVALFYDSGGGITSYGINIAKINLQTGGASTIYRYTYIFKVFLTANSIEDYQAISITQIYN